MGMKAEEVLAIAIAKIKSGGGTGGGDMNKSDYDPNSVVREAGGIEEFVNGIGTNKANESTISRVENGNTASAKIDKDEQFYHNNVLYTATSDIAQGGNIVTSGTGQNCVVSPSITSQIAQKADKSSLGTASAKNAISVVTDSTDLVESGAVYDALGFGNKNLLDADDITLTANGNIVPDTYIDLKSGTYTFSFDVSGTIGSNKAYTVIDRSAGSDVVLVTGTLVTGRNSITFTTETPITVFRSYTNSNATLTFSNIQLEKGSTATTYEPYHASVEEQISKKININVGRLSTLDAIAELVPNVYDNALMQISSSVTSLLTNGEISATSRITVHKTASDAVDWYGQIASTYYGCGRIAFVNNVWGYKTHNISSKKVDNSVIAPVENGSTASQAYAVGSHAIRNGAFITWKNAKAQGETINDASDYTAGDVASQIKDANDYIEDLYSHIGYLSTPVPAYVARQAPKRFKDITNNWFSGTLRTEIASGDFKNIIPGDYVIDPTTGSKFYVANLDGRIGLGDNTNNTNYPAYGTHHVNFMLEKAGSGATRMWSGYGYSDKSWRVSANDKNRCPWNAETSVDPTDSEAIGSNSTNITRSYGGSNMSAYMGSFIRQRIDEVLLPLFQSVFGSSNILKYREWNSNGIDTTAVSPAQTSWTGIANNCAWVDRYLDLPSEIELYGARIASSSYRDVGCQCEKLPLFDGAMLHNIFPRMDVWTKAVASSSLACIRYDSGNANASNASYARWACPLACVK